MTGPAAGRSRVGLPDGSAKRKPRGRCAAPYPTYRVGRRGEIVPSEAAIHSGLGGEFDAERIPTARVKGLAGMVTAYRVSTA